MLKRLSIFWLLFVPLATLLEVLTYSGLYRWLCEWQLASGGEYEGFSTAVIPAVLLIIPAIVYLRSQLPDKPRVPIDPAAAEKVALRVLGTIGLGATTVCVGALLWAWHLPSRNGASITVDLATLGNSTPPLGRVTLIGVIDADHVTRKLVTGKASIHNERNLYAPMIIRGSAAGTGRIFVDEYVDGDVDQPLPTASGNQFKGVLVEGGLPNDMWRQFARIGVRVTDPYYVLRTGPDGDREGYYVAAGLSGFVAALALIPLAIALVSLARRHRR